MRKLFALLFVAAAFTFAACEKKGGEATNDTTNTAAGDSTLAPEAPATNDTTNAGAGADTTAKAADTTKAAH